MIRSSSTSATPITYPIHSRRILQADWCRLISTCSGRHSSSRLVYLLRTTAGRLSVLRSVLVSAFVKFLRRIQHYCTQIATSNINVFSLSINVIHSGDLLLKQTIHIIVKVDKPQYCCVRWWWCKDSYNVVHYINHIFLTCYASQKLTIERFTFNSKASACFQQWLGNQKTIITLPDCLVAATDVYKSYPPHGRLAHRIWYFSIKRSGSVLGRERKWGPSDAPLARLQSPERSLVSPGCIVVIRLGRSNSNDVSV